MRRPCVTRSRLTALVSPLAACVLLAGCGLTNVGQTYDASLIRQVGAGSDAVASILPSLQARAKVPGSFSNPQISQAATLLAEGQLAKLTVNDLLRLANANRQSAARFPQALGKLDALASSITSAKIDPSAHRNLSSGAKQFIAAWDRYLAATAGQVRMVRQAFGSVEPVFNEFQALLRAGYETTKLGSVSQFDKVRVGFLKDVGVRYARFQGTAKSVEAQTPADRSLRALVASNQEAQAIVRKVNADYPNGSLAQEFRTS